MDRHFLHSGTASPHFWDGFGLLRFPTLCTYTDYLLKTNDALSPAPDRFPQVSFRLRSVSFGQDHHVLRTRNRACIAWPRDFIVPASNVVLHHLKKGRGKLCFPRSIGVCYQPCVSRGGPPEISRRASWVVPETDVGSTKQMCS